MSSAAAARRGPSSARNRQYVFLARPTGLADRSHFELREAPVREPEEGEVVVRTRYLSLDPTNRIWMSDQKQYMPPMNPGDVVRARPGRPAGAPRCGLL